MSNTRALNLEVFYKGFKNYGCPHRKTGDVELQKFKHANDSTLDYPIYECVIAPDDCQAESDRHLKHVRCYCYGDSCVRYKKTTLETGAVKTTAHINHDDDFMWHGCDYNWDDASACACNDRNYKCGPSHARDSSTFAYLMPLKSGKKNEETRDEL